MSSMDGQVVRWGVLSTADIGVRRLIPAMRQARGNAIVSLASRSRERAEAVGARLEIPRLYGRYEDVLDDAAVDAVYIPLPNSLHAEWTIRAAQAGKHVLCEKPMAATVAECRAMVAACRNAGVRFMEGFMYRFHPQHARLRELVASGLIGEPTLVRSSFCVRMQRPAEDIRFSLELAGGALLDLGVYAIDGARWLAGAAVTSTSGQVALGPSGVDVSASAALSFANGVLGAVTCSFVAAGGGSLEVLGPLGKITLHHAFSQPPGSRPRLTCETPDGQREESFEADINPYVLMLEAFGQAVLTGRDLPIADDNGIANIAVIESLLGHSSSG